MSFPPESKPPLESHPCPERIELRSFLAGSIADDARVIQVADHLETCPECLKFLDQIRADSDTSLQDFAAVPLSKIHDEFEAEAECARATTLIEALPRRNGGADLPDSIGAYRILDLISRGGMGVAYKAWHEHLKRVVVLKLIGHNHAQNPEFLAQFAREQEIIGKLNHPNIAAAYDAGVHQGQPFLVLEYVEGRTLQEFIRLEERLDVHFACRLAREIAIALAYIHESGFVHRDIKPANIIVTPRHTIKILDFGLAFTRQQSNGPKVVPMGGTVNYRAPEQTQAGAVLDPRTDLFSLGTTLYAMLTGSIPIPVPESTDSNEAPITASPTLQQLRPDVPQELTDLVDALCAPDPAKRPETAQVVASILATFCTSPDVILDQQLDPRRQVQPTVARSTPRMNWQLAILLIACAMPVLLWKLWINDSQQVTESIQSGEMARPTTAAKQQISAQPAHQQIAQVPLRDSKPEESRAEPMQPPQKRSIRWRPGPSTGQLPGLALDSARLPGVHRWQVDTRLPRGAIRRLSWNASESSLACFSDDGYIRLYQRKESELDLIRLIPVNGSSIPEFRTLQWDPEGVSLLAGDSHHRCELDLWHPASGTIQLEFRPHQTGIAATAWATDGQRFASVGADGLALVWDRSGRSISRFTGHSGGVWAVAWHPTKPIIASAGDDLRVRIWNSVSGTLIADWSGHTHLIRDLKWHPIQDQLVSCDDQAVHVWAVESKHWNSPAHRILGADAGGVRQLAWRNDGRHLATAGREVRVWDAELQHSELIASDDIDHRIEALDWSPKSNTLTFASVYGSIQEWNPTTRLTSVLLPRPRSCIQDLAWNRQGTTLAIQADSGYLHLFDPSGLRRGRIDLKTSRPGTGRFRIDPSGQQLATTSTQTKASLDLWNLPEGQHVRNIPVAQSPQDLDWLENPLQIVTSHADNSIRAWTLGDFPDTPSIEPQAAQTAGQRLYQHSAAITEITTHSTQRLLAIGDSLGAIHVIDLRGTEPMKLCEFKASELPIIQISWNRQGTFLAARDAQTTRLYAMTTRTEYWHFTRPEPHGNLSWIAQDRRLLIGSVGGIDVPELRLQPPLNLWSVAAADDTGNYLADAGMINSCRVRVIRSYRNQWALTFVNDQPIAFNRSGQVHPSTAEMVDELTYQIEQPRGAVNTLTYQQFLKRFPGYDQFSSSE